MERIFKFLNLLGYNTIAVEDMKIVLRDLSSKNAKGMYSANDKCIYIDESFYNNSDARTLYAIVAHELVHAIQDSEGRLLNLPNITMQIVRMMAPSKMIEKWAYENIPAEKEAWDVYRKYMRMSRNGLI